jgi:hypothetical protein
MCTVVSGYLCPSSGHAKTYNYDLTDPSTRSSLGYDANNYGMLEYAGIAGSDRYGTPYTYPSKAGVLYYRSKVAAAEIHDGLSNTMAVGEYSGLAPGQAYRGNLSLRNNDGTWGLGYSGGNPNQGINYTWSVKTVSHPPNTAWYNAESGSDPPINGGTYIVAQAALKSNHPGGISAVLCDGSVTFLSNAINLTVYKDLADRDDGHPVVPF